MARVNGIESAAHDRQASETEPSRWAEGRICFLMIDKIPPPHSGCQLPK